MLLSDLTASVEYPLAEQVLVRLGEEPPEDDELDEVWPIGDLDLFTDLGLTEDEMERVLDDLDAYPDEMLETVVERIGLAEPYARATESAQWAGELLRSRPDPRWRSTGARRKSTSTTARTSTTSPRPLRDIPGDIRLLVVEAGRRVRRPRPGRRRPTIRGSSCPTATPPTCTRWPRWSPTSWNEIGEDVLDDDEDAPPAHDSAPFGDADLVADLGTSAVTCWRCARTRARCPST